MLVNRHRPRHDAAAGDRGAARPPSATPRPGAGRARRSATPTGRAGGLRPHVQRHGTLHRRPASSGPRPPSSSVPRERLTAVGRARPGGAAVRPRSSRRGADRRRYRERVHRSDRLDRDHAPSTSWSRLLGEPDAARPRQGAPGAARRRPRLAGRLAVLRAGDRCRRRHAATPRRRATRPGSWSTSSTTARSRSPSGPATGVPTATATSSANPHVGLNFLIPGRGDTLRINGRARLVSDAPFFDEMVVKGHRPVLAVVVEIDEMFFHCAEGVPAVAAVEPGDLGPRRHGCRGGRWSPHEVEPNGHDRRGARRVLRPVET